MRFIKNGFTLIELMVVIGIIGILATIAMPSYQKYMQRARFSEVIIATEPFKLAVSLALQQGIQASEIKNGLNGIPKEPTPTIHLASLKVENGIIYAKSTKIAGDATLLLIPNEEGNAWTIGTDSTCLTLELCYSS